MKRVAGPRWWDERRYGMFVRANIATVPSFSPIGEEADWYWSHLGGVPARDRPMVGAPAGGGEVHASPLAEVLAYHGDRWPHVAHYDDFLPFLSLHRFDADAVVDLACVSGMHFLVQTAKHHDGLCWWDAPGTDRTSVLHGPQRNLVAEISAACRRRDVVYGVHYALDDWAEARRDVPAYARDILHPQVLDLVERYGAEILWGDAEPVRRGDGDAPAAAPMATRELIERAVDVADVQGFTLAHNDGWLIADATFRTVTHRPPTRICTSPWAFRRPLGASRQFNRAERSEHLLSAGGLLDLLTEVVAKGGNLLIDVSVGVDGTVPESHQRPLRAVGAWLQAHPGLLDSSRPFDEWGDAQVRYLRAGDDTDAVVAIDLTAAGEIVFAGFTPDRHEVTSVVADDGAALHWEQHAGGVVVTRLDRSPTGLAGVYRLGVRPAPQPIRLFEEAGPLRSLAALLDGAAPGAIVQLPDGSHGEVMARCTVPPGVTLRGAGWDRTMVDGPIVLSDDARLEGIHVRGAGPLRLDGAGATIVSCRVDGRIEIAGHDATVRDTIGTTIVIGAERATVERCSLRGRFEDVGIEADGGFGHRIAGNELVDHLCSIRLHEATASTVTGNVCSARWWAIHLVQCEHVEVLDNTVRNTMRAVDVDGGVGAIVRANRVADGDSGAVVEFGAQDTSVADNHIERCRVGVLVWDAPTTRIGANTFVDIHEDEPCVFGPDSDR